MLAIRFVRRSVCSVAVALSASTTSLSFASCPSLIMPLMLATSSGTVTNARPIRTMPSNVRGRRIFIRDGLDGSLRPMSRSEFSFPFKRRCYDFGEIVVPRLPAERGTDASRASDQCRRIAGPTRLLPFGYGVSGDALDHGKQLADAVASPVAAVQCRGFAAAAQVCQGLQMGVCQVLDMNVVADAGTVRCRVIRTENRDVRPFADDDFACDLREKRCARR